MDLVGADYIVIPSDKEEDMSGHEPSVLVEKLSKMKAEDVAAKIKGRVDIGSLSKDYLNSVTNLYPIGRNGMHKYNNMDHSILTALETVDCITRSTDKSSIWEVNTEQAYHEQK